MTSLNLANQIPSNINTLERLHIWSGYALAFVNPSLGVLETPERAEKVAQAAIFQAADNTYRVLLRACLPVDQSFMNDSSKKMWMFGQEVSNVALPTAFTTN
ncbi:MAG: glucose-6-phosphate dehydrogenase [Bacteroidota bacterium]